MYSEELSFFNLVTILTSLAKVSQNLAYFDKLAEVLILKLRDATSDIEINSYVNLWLAMACFGIKLPHDIYSAVASELTRIY